MSGSVPVLRNLRISCLCVGLSSPFPPKMFLPMLPILTLKTSRLLLEGVQKARLCGGTLAHTPSSHLESGIADRAFGDEFLKFINAFRFHSESIPVSFFRDIKQRKFSLIIWLFSLGSLKGTK